MDQPITLPESPYEASRRIANLLRLGTVAEVRLVPTARCRVKTGDLLTDWIPWLTLRAGGKDGGSSWWAPAVGEQCLLLSPGGDLLQAIALPGIYSDAMPAPGFTPDTLVFRIGESSIVMGKNNMTLAAGGATLHLDKGKVTATTDMVAGGVSLVEHPHSGVTSGPDASGPPIATDGPPPPDAP